MYYLGQLVRIRTINPVSPSKQTINIVGIFCGHDGDQYSVYFRYPSEEEGDIYNAERMEQIFHIKRKNKIYFGKYKTNVLTGVWSIDEIKDREKGFLALINRTKV